MATGTVVAGPAAKTLTSDRLTEHWFLMFAVGYGLWVLLPFMAPVLMHAGWIAPGRTIYFIYSFFCHQLPERSFFLFGPKVMYTLPEIQAAGPNSSDMLLLRRFVGSASMGWKVAWSDRMVSFYTSIWIFGIVWKLLGRKVKSLPWWGLLLLLLPIVVDGGSHAVSDLAGIGQGFRDTNQWLRLLTDNIFPASFYAGDALGSFNSWMRLITGVLAGLGIVWFAFRYVEASFAEE